MKKRPIKTTPLPKELEQRRVRLAAMVGSLLTPELIQALGLLRTNQLTIEAERDFIRNRNKKASK